MTADYYLDEFAKLSAKTQFPQNPRAQGRIEADGQGAASLCGS